MLFLQNFTVLFCFQTWLNHDTLFWNFEISMSQASFPIFWQLFSENCTIWESETQKTPKNAILTAFLQHEVTLNDDKLTWICNCIRFKSPDYSSQKGKRFTKQNKKVLNSLNRKIFRRASKLLQSHWPRRYFLSLHISKQKMICKSILSWPVGFEKKNWSSCLMPGDFIGKNILWKHDLIELVIASSLESLLEC